MNAALITPSFPTALLYAASLVFVMWTVVDVMNVLHPPSRPGGKRPGSSVQWWGGCFSGSLGRSSPWSIWWGLVGE